MYTIGFVFYIRNFNVCSMQDWFLGVEVLNYVYEFRSVNGTGLEYWCDCQQ